MGRYGWRKDVPDFGGGAHEASGSVSSDNNASNYGGYAPKPSESASLVQWLASDGKIGAPPYWYLVIRAAKYLGLSPAILLKMPAYWLYAAIEAESAEGKVQEWQYKRLRSK
jgi:hypothetical protein